MIKEEAFEASEVTNWLLSNFDSNQYAVTNLKINKVLYFLHGVVLARENRPLLRNHFECWENGPVISSLYQRLKRWSDKPIEEPLFFLDYSDGETKVVDSSKVELLVSNTTKKAATFFMEKDVWWLVNESHERGGPWDMAKQNLSESIRSARISDWWIKEHFVNKYGGTAAN